jgi:hypothetical protein
MSRGNILKLMHFANTAWFMLCVGYILVLALWQAGVRWWVIFSLSGYSALLLFLMISLYLFAIFRGIGRSQTIEAEHPLTNTDYYAVLYVVAPFLGGLAGCIGMIGLNNRVSQYLLGIALGTLGATFLVWVIVDPLTGLLETQLLPASRKHRAERLAHAKAQREEKQKEHKRLLVEVLAKEQSTQHSWQQALRPHAEKLAELLTTVNETDFRKAELEAINIGVNAWQSGGLNCMRQLRDMAIEIHRKKYQDSMIVDYISSWWDGVGTWRNTSLG